MKKLLTLGLALVIISSMSTGCVSSAPYSHGLFGNLTHGNKKCSAKKTKKQKRRHRLSPVKLN